MKKETLLNRPLSGERGMALISALLLLLVVSLMAVGLSMDTSMDVRISAYQRFMARSFGFADAGLMAASDILEENAFESGWTDTIPFTFPRQSPAYVGDIQILQDGAFYLDRNPTMQDIISMTGDLQADIATQYVSSQLAVGGAIQVAAGYSGTGKGTGGGGGHILYNLEGSGWDANQTRTRLGLNYRFVTK
jgi:Tfp pilus assembly protein PilX